MYPSRSEEHTSELQSLRHLVCRLLLEKNRRRKADCRDVTHIVRPIYPTHILPAGLEGGPESLPSPTSCCRSRRASTPLLFFFNDTATTEIYTLSLHDALPISIQPRSPRPASGVFSSVCAWRT